MNIVFCIRRYCPGEAWTNRVLAYIKGFAELGNNVCVYFLISDTERTKEIISVPNVKVVSLWENDGYFARKSKKVSFFKNLFLFARKCQWGDVVFLFGIRDYMHLILGLLQRKTKVFFESTEHPFVFGLQKNKIRYLTYKHTLKKLDGLFVISKSLYEYYSTVGVQIDKIEIINMFVDTERFNNLEKTTSEKFIAYCGAVSYDKDGANILIEAFSIFHKTHPEYKLKIIGKGVDSTTIDRLKDLAKSLSVEEDVIFTGPISPSEMPQMLYDASILALARPNNLQAQNGFPTKLGEYLATGNPVVVTKVGDIPLFVKHQENGFLSDPIPECFAEQLTFVADNYSMAKEVGERGRKLAFTEFSYKTQTAKALSLMNSNS